MISLTLANNLTLLRANRTAHLLRLMLLARHHFQILILSFRIGLESQILKAILIQSGPENKSLTPMTIDDKELSRSYPS